MENPDKIYAFYFIYGRASLPKIKVIVIYTFHCKEKEQFEVKLRQLLSIDLIVLWKLIVNLQEDGNYLENSIQIAMTLDNTDDTQKFPCSWFCISIAIPNDIKKFKRKIILLFNIYIFEQRMKNFIKIFLWILDGFSLFMLDEMFLDQIIQLMRFYLLLDISIKLDQVVLSFLDKSILFWIVFTDLLN